MFSIVYSSFIILNYAFLNLCIYEFIEFMYLLFLNLYPFYDLMIFIYNPKEMKLSSRKQYK